jgi:ribose transport system substrate-binding protein
VEVGRIQGKQFAALLPEGGSILYIEGPAASSAAKDRTRGMNETKPANIHAKVMRANWTEESSYRAVSSWLRLRTSHEMHIALVGAQDDSMAMGARRAFAELTRGDRERWLKMPFTGCDGMPKTGQAWVRSGELAATIFIRPNTDLAVEMLTEAIRNRSPLPEQHLTIPESVPAFGEITSRAAKSSAAKQRSASV